MSDDRDLAIELLEELEVAANEGQAGKGPLRADYVATHVRSAIVQMRADRRELADKDAMWRTADRELAEAQRHIEALKREVCTCPWPEDAMRTRHLLSCRLMQMEHAAGQTALREAEQEKALPVGHVCTHCGYCDQTLYGDNLYNRIKALKGRVKKALLHLDCSICECGARLSETDAADVLREAEDYPPGAACTRHLGEPWPCPRCVALREAEDA